MNSNNAPFISIQVPSNRPDQIIIFLDHLEKSANDYSSFEVLVNLDVDDVRMSQLLEKENAKRPFSIRYINTFSGGFYNSWKPINDFLALINPNIYFMTFLSDEFLFETKGWDDILKSYIGYYQDNIFRLRASQFRYRNYVDYWECGFAPDSICFYTKKWVDLCGDWAPCFSSDAFQQCISYYLFTSDPFTKEQYNRDIPVHNLEFRGEGASIGLTGEKAFERVKGSLPAWFKLMSYPMQLEARRRAMILKANIEMAKFPEEFFFTITDNANENKIVLNSDQGIKITFSYKLNRIRIYLINQLRKLNYLYYAGGGSGSRINLKNFRWHVTYYLSFKYKTFKLLHNKCNHAEDKLKFFFKKMLKIEVNQ